MTKIFVVHCDNIHEEQTMRAIINSFTNLLRDNHDIHLYITGKKQQQGCFNAWNLIEQNQLIDKVMLFPYYDFCNNLPIKKLDVDLWIDKTILAKPINDIFLTSIDNKAKISQRRALFFTPYHPLKQEGNSRGMRQWLDYLKNVGYEVHLIWYMLDEHYVGLELREQSKALYSIYKEIPVRSASVGINANLLNIHVDDWCGIEALNAISELNLTYDYDVAIANYAFTTAIFNQLSSFTKKILLTHDNFTNRNRRMVQQGYLKFDWLSLTENGESLACDRSDVIAAVQLSEKEHFIKVSRSSKKVVTISPVLPKESIEIRPFDNVLTIGFFGSSNTCNEFNVAKYIKAWADNHYLIENSKILIGGGISDNLHNYLPPHIWKLASPQVLGRFEEMTDFFSQCDLIINPETGGTGIKIKTLETLAAAMPLISTSGGTMGIDTSSRFHTAEDVVTLVKLTEEVARKPELINCLRDISCDIYSNYFNQNNLQLKNILGDKNSLKYNFNIPQYVEEEATDYHLDEFSKIYLRANIKGRRVLEIGSDYHLATARLFDANGAAKVVATNLGDWCSDEPLPESIDFVIGDSANLDFPDASFDVIYGIAVLEHILDFDKFSKSIHRLLAPGGIIYLQGYPLWPSALGHHAWHECNITGTAIYDFSNPKKNPVPDWAHLILTPEDLSTLLITKGESTEDANRLVDFIYNRKKNVAASCSNFISSSAILSALSPRFDITYERVQYISPVNDYFKKALSQYSEEDLSTIGLNVWLTAKEYFPYRSSDNTPLVSIIIPIYNVELYLMDCLNSVITQVYDHLQIILVDDASTDDSLAIAQQFEKQDKRISIYKTQKKQGLGTARNKGIELAKGEYLLFLDSEDCLSTTYAIEQLLSNALYSECNVVIGTADYMNDQNKKANLDCNYQNIKTGITEGKSAYLAASCLSEDYLPIRSCGILIHKTILDDHELRFINTEHKDMGFTPFLCLAAKRVLYIPQVVVTYRYRKNSLLNNTWSIERCYQYVNLWKQIKGHHKKFQIMEFLSDNAIFFLLHFFYWNKGISYMNSHVDDLFQSLSSVLMDIKKQTDEKRFNALIKDAYAINGVDWSNKSLYNHFIGLLNIENKITFYSEFLGYHKHEKNYHLTLNDEIDMNSIQINIDTIKKNLIEITSA